MKKVKIDVKLIEQLLTTGYENNIIITKGISKNDKLIMINLVDNIVELYFDTTQVEDIMIEAETIHLGD